MKMIWRMKYRYRFVTRCIGAVVLMLGAPNAFAWTDKDYDKHDYRAFARLPVVNERIDMKHIDYALLNAALFYETNRQRALHGKRAFRHSPVLEKAAAGHSRDMVSYGFFSHESPVEGKKDPGDRLAIEGLALINVSIGENLGDVFGIEYESGKRVFVPGERRKYFRYEPDGKPIQNRTYGGLAKEALAGWMNSRHHRRNILNDDFQYLGVGAAHYIDPGFHDIDCFKMTQNFSGNVTLRAGKKK